MPRIVRATQGTERSWKGRLSLAGLLLTLLLGVMAPGEANAQMCVRVVRSLTNFSIRGDAWAWWDGAAGRYSRDSRPAVGSVLVFKRSRHMPRGHVSVVSAVTNSRVIRVDHSWLGGQGLIRGMRVVDISPENDWSDVRVWHPRIDDLGLKTYTTYGFIHPNRFDRRDPAFERDDGLTNAAFSTLRLDSDDDDGGVENLPPPRLARLNAPPRRTPSSAARPAAARSENPARPGAGKAEKAEKAEKTEKKPAKSAATPAKGKPVPPARDKNSERVASREGGKEAKDAAASKSRVNESQPPRRSKPLPGNKPQVASLS